MLNRLPKKMANDSRIGQCIGTVFHSVTNSDVGFCILWSDGDYEICLDQGSLLGQLHVLRVKPRGLSGIGARPSVGNSDHPTVSFEINCVTDLQGQGAVVSVMDRKTRRGVDGHDR